MTKNKIYTREEMREKRIHTSEYRFMDRAGEYTATLKMRAEASSGMLRLFFRLESGEKIITPVFWWQEYLGFYDIENGTKMKLMYKQTAKGVYLCAVEILDRKELTND